MDGFKDTSVNHDVEVPKGEREKLNPKDATSIPSIDELSHDLNDVLGVEIPEEKPVVVDVGKDGIGDDSGTITLDDGTVVTMPERPGPGPVYLENHDNTDDNGKTYRTEDGDRVPNNTYELDGSVYKTDDNGNIYSIDGKLQPNETYVLNGNVYTTDDKGRIVSCEATPERSPENSRDIEAQRKAGGEDRKENDQGGHIVSRDMNGDSGDGNLIAMDSKINQSDYKRMENDIKSALDDGKEVTTKTEMTYSDDSERPDTITVTVTADGEQTVYKFDNNLDGELRNDVPENGKAEVQEELNDTNGEISSIKEEYDENGNLKETTVTITYTDENGATHRTKVYIEGE